MTSEKTINKRRTVLFWTTYSGFEPILQTELELIHRERKRGSLVIGAFCGGALPRCHAQRKRRREYFECAICKATYYEKVAPLFEKIVLLSNSITRWKNPFLARTHDELKGLYYKGSDIGTAVLSTLMTNALDAKVDITNNTHQAIAQLSTAAIVHDQMTNVLDEIKPDAVYLFNGRHFDSRPVLRLCQARGIEFFTYEVAVQPDRFTIFRNSTPHDIKYFKARFRASSIKLNTADIVRLKSEIEAGKDIYNKDFRKQQAEGYLPETFDSSRKNVTILHSSEDEFAADGFHHFWFGRDFEEVLQTILSKCEDGRLHIYVRIHPRLARFRSNEVARLKSIYHPKLTLISPESPVNTFKLALASEANICFGSTAGIEAALLGARVVCIAHCFYNDLGIFPDVRTLDELVTLLLNPEQIMCDKYMAAAYLTFVKSDGEHYSDSEGVLPATLAQRTLRVRKVLQNLRLPYNKLALDKMYYLLCAPHFPRVSVEKAASKTR
jgi:hypothetical protein